MLVGFLNKIFSDFDYLAELYGLEKIKTIGDAYMVGGVCQYRVMTIPGKFAAWQLKCRRLPEIY